MSDGNRMGCHRTSFGLHSHGWVNGPTSLYGLQLKGLKPVADMSTYKEQWVHQTGGYCISDAMPAGSSLPANTGTWRKTSGNLQNLTDTHTRVVPCSAGAGAPDNIDR